MIQVKNASVSFRVMANHRPELINSQGMRSQQCCPFNQLLLELHVDTIPNWFVTGYLVVLVTHRYSFNYTSSDVKKTIVKPRQMNNQLLINPRFSEIALRSLLLLLRPFISDWFIKKIPSSTQIQKRICDQIIL